MVTVIMLGNVDGVLCWRWLQPLLLKLLLLLLLLKMLILLLLQSLVTTQSCELPRVLVTLVQVRPRCRSRGAAAVTRRLV